ncbi:N-acetylmuramoyl-L-alanine amidase family protein [Flavobacterium orientale]|uniref:N-acetylmuramoyl-L-alanine amidase n=1 Tax=Flavobacterium orientale TaxID=1756020 RepID=A0A916YAU6_9FLAO|nr:N-acetylmuramoyl-L-alanine amidase [Flavobacterium orientale]GGD36061.1 N-acetylmuramoyl-L-alanine amidase [Flavobacterium orientale]
MQLLQHTKYFVFTLFLISSFTLFGQTNSKFKIVLDAGHGGKDFGAIHHGFVEKSIALNVTLKVGKLLEKYNDIEIVYTRKTDVFIELTQRAHIANRADAQLFVSIHCNGVKSHEPSGTETFVMGLTRNATNLEVAKKENSVITLEADYKVKYAGFDPNNPETLIGLKIIQEENLYQSITLASKIQDNFTNDLNRKNRGVKQAPIWVLDATVMPGVLVELGFLSNKVEGAYLNTEKGQDELAKAVAEGILSYKKEYYGTASVVSTPDKPVKQVVEKPNVSVAKQEPQKSTPEVKETKVTPANKTFDATAVVFKVQLSASGKLLETTPGNFKGLQPISIFEEGGLYKYYFQATTSYSEAQQFVKAAKEKGYEAPFIVAFKEGKKIKLEESMKKN